MNPMNTLITVHTDAGPLQLPAPATLADAVAALIAKRSAGEAETHIRALATAVNGHFVPRDARQTHLLQEGDQVLCFSPITGG